MMNKKKAKKAHSFPSKRIESILRDIDHAWELDRTDHYCCMEQEDPACGIDKHTQCCLCRKQNENK